jgi:hypothetical protein
MTSLVVNSSLSRRKLIKMMSIIAISMSSNKVIAIITLLTVSLISSHSSILAHAQNDSNRITTFEHPGQNTGGGDETATPETVTTTEGTEQKIRCSNGSLVDSGSECTTTDECPSEPSENVTLQCIQPSQQISDNNNTNATNASSLFDGDDTGEDSNEDSDADSPPS